MLHKLGLTFSVREEIGGTIANYGKNCYDCTIDIILLVIVNTKCFNNLKGNTSNGLDNILN